MLLNMCRNRLLRSTKKQKEAESGRVSWPLTKQISEQDLQVLRCSLKQNPIQPLFCPISAYPEAQHVAWDAPHLTSWAVPSQSIQGTALQKAPPSCWAAISSHPCSRMVWMSTSTSLLWMSSPIYLPFSNCALRCWFSKSLRYRRDNWAFLLCSLMRSSGGLCFLFPSRSNPTREAGMWRVLNALRPGPHPHPSHCNAGRLTQEHSEKCLPSILGEKST